MNQLTPEHLSSLIEKHTVATVILSVYAAGCLGQMGTPDPGKASPNVNAFGVVESEVQQAFNDSACYCEAYLLHPPEERDAQTISLYDFTPLRTQLTSPSGATCAADKRLSAYAAEHSVATGRFGLQRQTCTAFAADSEGETRFPYGALPGRLARDWGSFGGQIPSDREIRAEWRQNACIQAVSIVDDTSFVNGPVPGFCRADFNFCLAEQLHLKAHSFAKGASNRDTRDAILKEGRERYQKAANEYLGTLFQLYSTTTILSTGNCRDFDPIDGIITNAGLECERLVDGYGEVLVARLSEAVSQIVEVAKDEVHSRMAAGDALLRSTSNYLESLWGPGSARVDALRVLFGDHDPATTPGITYLTNGLHEPEVPANLRHDKVNNNTHYRLYLERPAVKLSQALVVDRPGGGGRTIAAGTRVRSYLVHFDPWGSDSHTVDGNIAFNQPILGIIQTTGRLNSSDGIVGHPGTAYQTGAKRGIEAGDAVPFIDASAEAYNLSFSLTAWQQDQFRVIVLADAPFSAQERAGDLAYARQVVADQKVHQALDLILKHRAPTTRYRCTWKESVLNEGWLEAEDDVGVGALAYDFVDRKLLTLMGFSVPPGPIDPDRSLLRQEHNLRAEHFVAALTLLRDMVATLQVDYTTSATSVVYDGSICWPGQGVWLDALSITSIAQRATATTIAPLGRASDGAWSWPEYRSCHHADATPRYYNADLPQMERAGAANALDILRGQFWFWDTLTAGKQPTWYDGDAIANLTSLIDRSVGKSWTFYQHGRANGRIGLWFAVAPEPSPGRPLIVYGNATADCVMHGHRPRGDDTASCGVVHIPVETGSGSTWVRPYRGFAVPPPPQGAAMAQVLWQTCPGNPTCADEAITAGQHEIVDAFYPRHKFAAHPHGGDFGDLARELLTRQAGNPAYAVQTALGVPRDYVPPLEHVLNDDGDGSEDSFRWYLKQAKHALSNELNTGAAQLLIAARDNEILMIREQQATEAQRLSALQARSDRLYELCGPAGGVTGCDVPRIDLTLAELGLITAPTGAPPTGPGGEACAEYVHTFMDDAHEIDTASRLAIRLRAALRCGDWLTRRALAPLALNGLPVPLHAALLADDDVPALDGIGGSAGDLLLNQFKKLVAIRNALQDYADTVTKVDLEIQNIKHAIKSREHGWGCWAGGLLSGAGEYFGGAAMLLSGDPAGAASMFNGGSTLVNLQDTCGAGDFNADVRRSFQVLLDAFMALRQYSTEAQLFTIDVAQDNLRLDAIARNAEVADTQHDIQQLLVDATYPSGDPAWRVLQAEQAESARRQLRYAQQQAFFARRAIELRLGIDLPEAATGDPPPATWANDVFGVDAATVQGRSVAAERLQMYVGTLETFLDNYIGVGRVINDGHDVQVLNLSQVLSGQMPPFAPGEVLDIEPWEIPLHRRLLYKCHGHGSLLLSGMPPDYSPTTADDAIMAVEPCLDLGGVEYAVVPFNLPSPLSGYFQKRLIEGGFNYRLNWLALNFFNEGLKDCELLPPDQGLECREDHTLKYELQHQGDVIVENYDAQRISFPLNPGRLLGRGLVKEDLFIGVPLSAEHANLLNDLRQESLRGRPLLGGYRLILPSAEETVWQALDEIQVIMKYDFWVRQ